MKAVRSLFDPCSALPPSVWKGFAVALTAWAVLAFLCVRAWPAPATEHLFGLSMFAWGAPNLVMLVLAVVVEAPLPDAAMIRREVFSLAILALSFVLCIASWFVSNRLSCVLNVTLGLVFIVWRFRLFSWQFGPREAGA